ncbi:MAG TPA: diaminopimelate epimerase, partial [Vicinamibacterales bacterium]|nr:diaminopimelate epimerase [Vicinamibacterales bacterium]
MTLVKAHAYGNDFLLLDEAQASRIEDHATFARDVCERHRGIGADGLIVYSPTDAGARMHLLNADGSPSEISGNGVRCLGAWIARTRALAAGASIDVETEAGTKRLDLLEMSGGRYIFRAAMGEPTEIARQVLDVDGQGIDAVTLRVGNPQCVVLGEVNESRLYSIASRLAVHPHFPAGTNVEL